MLIGLLVEVKRIINEPTAAALAFGMENKGGSTTQIVPVYHLGGGTLRHLRSSRSRNIDGDKQFEVLSTNVTLPRRRKTSTSASSTT